MVKLSDLGEKTIVQSVVLPLFAELGESASIGDDAALVEIDKSTTIAISTDRMPDELIAKSLGLLNESDQGRYLIISNLSDIAAMGADPIALLTTLVFPSNFDLNHFKEFLNGISSASQQFDVPVVGGDTKSGLSRSCSAVAIGVLPTGEGLKRSTAKAGDLIFVTGTPCGFSAALCFNLMSQKKKSEFSHNKIKELNAYFSSQTPRIKEGILLRESRYATACQDISDGIGQTIFELAAASNLGAVIDISKLLNAAPKSIKKISTLSGIPSSRILLGPSADYELVFCVNKNNESSIYEIFSKLNTPINKIGVLTEDQNIRIKEENGTLKTFENVGWQSFDKSTDKNKFKEIYG